MYCLTPSQCTVGLSKTNACQMLGCSGLSINCVRNLDVIELSIFQHNFCWGGWSGVCSLSLRLLLDVSGVPLASFGSTFGCSWLAYDCQWLSYGVPLAVIWGSIWLAWGAIFGSLWSALWSSLPVVWVPFAALAPAPLESSKSTCAKVILNSLDNYFVYSPGHPG